MVVEHITFIRSYNFACVISAGIQFIRLSHSAPSDRKGVEMIGVLRFRIRLVPVQPVLGTMKGVATVAVRDVGSR